MLVGCGSGHATPTTTAAKNGPFHVHLGPVFAVQVYFCSKLVCAAKATRAKERTVETRLRSEPCVRKIVFISKAEALAIIKRTNPTLYSSMPAGVGNPLPDSVRVLTVRPSCAPALAAAARAAHWPGVQQIGLKHRPATRAGS